MLIFCRRYNSYYPEQFDLSDERLKVLIDANALESVIEYTGFSFLLEDVVTATEIGEGDCPDAAGFTGINLRNGTREIVDIKWQDFKTMQVKANNGYIFDHEATVRKITQEEDHQRSLNLNRNQTKLL